jgi:hypothetical protein
MPELKRPTVEADVSRSKMGTGIMRARVVNNLDPTYSGALEVFILRDESNDKGEDTQTFVVTYASPFFGHTPYEYTGLNTGEKNTQEGFNDTQKSYGMWMVPPDIGVTVLVAFVDGDPSLGYWFACVPPRFANHMTPGIAASPNVYLDDADKKKYGKDKDLPVAEYNKRINAKKEGDQVDVSKLKKAVHPIADRFLEQGLLDDDVRGITDSSARREAPSAVFGISSPGPLDRRPGYKKTTLGSNDEKTDPTIPTGRLGGTQIILDDGDDRFIREKASKEGPVKYVDAGKGEKGDPTIPKNEYFRIRTRTGHQILLHNSEDLIYIGNSRGTTWVEFTSNGKIDIYAADSVSIHTETDLNIRADRDINLEAGRNINMRTETGRWHAEVATDLEFLIAKDAKITVGADYNLLVGATTKISSYKDFNISTNGDNNLTAGGDTSIGSKGNHKETAATINMNNDLAAEAAEIAAFVTPLELRDNTVTSVSSGWDKKYQSGKISSIMRRIPMHEPWLQHENQAPALQTPAGTDRETDD